MTATLGERQHGRRTRPSASGDERQDRAPRQRPTKKPKRSKKPSVRERRSKVRDVREKRMERDAYERAQRRVRAVPPEHRIGRKRIGIPRRRLRLLLVVVVIVTAVAVGRLAQLQAGDVEELRSAGVAQWTRTIDLRGDRGTVFDRNGNELAMSVPALTISINPKLISDGDTTLRLLDDVLQLSDAKLEELTEEIATKERGFVYVRRQIDPAIGEQLEMLAQELGLPGINVDEDTRRELPGGDTGRSVVGRVDPWGEGISGLEKQFDDLLTGVDGTMTREIAPNGRTVPGSEVITAAPQAGTDIVLSVDRSIQFATERVLLDQVASIGAKGATAVVMETATGDLLASASVRLDEESGQYVVTSANYAAVDAYEPGSVGKVITVAGALDAGAVTPDTTFLVPWRKQYYDDLLKDAIEHPDEVMPVSRILSTSSNIGTIMIQEALGRFEHHDYLKAFGMGERTALDFPGESRGLLKDPDDLWGSERVTVAYGQGFASTTYQLAAAVNVIANDGVYVAPRLVRAFVTPEGELREADPSPERRVVNEQAARDTAQMMQAVVCEGTAKRAQVDGMSVAGKTGTAFKVADNGTYWNDEGNRIYYASFAGFFPVEDPQVTVLISVDEPPAGTNDRFGGTAAAPVFAELVPSIIHELGMTPPPGSTGCDGR